MALLRAEAADHEAVLSVRYHDEAATGTAPR